MTRDDALKRILDECLAAQRRYGVEIFFQWAPHVNLVEAFTYGNGHWGESHMTDLHYLFQKYLDDGEDYEKIVKDVIERLYSYFFNRVEA